MTNNDPAAHQPSLLERAAEIYDFGAALRRQVGGAEESYQRRSQSQHGASPAKGSRSTVRPCGRTI